MLARPVSLTRPRAANALLSAALLGSLLLAPALHAAPFTQPDGDFKGRVFAAGAALPGSEVTINGQGFKPGQRVTLSRGGQVLNATAYVADAEGNFSAKLQLPADAVPARHPVVVEVANPDAAAVFDLKISPDVAISGEKDFRSQSNKLVPGLYQVAYSAKSNAVYVTAAVGRPPVTSSQLVKVDPKSLKITAQATPPKAEGRDDGHVYAVYGVAVDDDKGTVWVTNTRDNTAAVYNQSDLSLVKQFERGAAAHSRDVVVATKQNKAYVSEVGVPTLAVFSTESLTALPKVQIESGIRGQDFSPMSLALDADNNRLYTVSMSTSQLAVIDTTTDRTVKVLPVPGAVSASGVAFDPKTQRAFIASQGSDNVVILDVNSGAVVNTVGTGAGTLNVVFEPVKSLAYVSNRGADTLTVLDVDGNIVANLPVGSFPNQAQVDGKGNVFVVNKARGPEDAKGDHITRINKRR